MSSKAEIKKIVSKYDELNDVGIKCTNFQLLSSVLIKNIILILIFIIFSNKEIAYLHFKNIYDKITQVI